VNENSSCELLINISINTSSGKKRVTQLAINFTAPINITKKRKTNNNKMTQTNKPLGITEVVLRDAHQSILATRLRIEDMLPICEKLDQIGYWSIESWGGATFDSCIRYLGEDPWERLRSFTTSH
jgi:pyruvate carboxylase